MSGINSMLAGRLAPSVRDIGGSIPVQGSVTPPGQGPGSSQSDVFDQGQWWRNRTQAKTFPSPTAAQCGCNTCPRCAARVYGVQDRVSSPDRISSSAAEEQSAAIRDSGAAAGETAGLQQTGDQTSAADPSPQDRKVAAAATMAITQARQEIMEEQQDLESQKNVVEAGARYGAVSGQEPSGMDGAEETSGQAVSPQALQRNNANSISRYTNTTPRIQSGGLDLTA